MKRFLALTLILITIVPAFGQVDQLYGEARLDYGAAIQDGAYKGKFKPDQLNLVLAGKIGRNLSYFWRQRFTKPLYNPDIPLNATDQVWLRWDINEHWAIQGGKIAVIVGGYEFDDAPVDLYYWGLFAGLMPDVYALGGNLLWKINPQQTLMAQLTQSPLGFGYANLFQAALVWYGRIAPWWNTIWSVNWMDDPAHNGLLVAGLGNRFEAGGFATELDFMYRTSAFQRNLPLDLSYVLKLEYKWPVLTVFAKGSYDYNRDCPADFVPQGTSAWILGGGVEVFPLRNDDLRLHTVGWWNSSIGSANFTVGITYRLRVEKILPR